MIYNYTDIITAHTQLQAKINNNTQRQAGIIRALDYLQFQQEEYARAIIRLRYNQTSQDVEKYICTIPLTRTLVNQRAKIFGSEPSIKLNTVEETSPVAEALTKILDKALFYYNLLSIDRYVETCHQVGVIPHYDADLDRIQLEILTPDRVIVWQDEKLPTKAKAVAYRIGVLSDTITNHQANKYALWTAETYSEVSFKTDYTIDQTYLSPIPNKYKRIPIVWFQNDLPLDTFWLDNGFPIVEANEKANIQLTNLDIGIDYQSFATKVTEGLPEEKTITAGVTRYLNIPWDYESGAASGKAYYITPNVDLKGIWDVINEAIAMTASLLGISTESIRQNSQFASGYQLRLSKADIIDYNNEKRSMYREATRQLVQLTADCYTLYAKKLVLPNDMDLNIDFADVKIENDPKQDEEVRMMKISNGTMSRVDALMQDNPDLTREDAVKEIARIDDENSRFKVSPETGLENFEVT